MIKSKFLFALLFIPFLSMDSNSCNRKNNTSADCIDKSKISNNPCTMDFDPVCGCDAKTYSNACVATNAGVTKWTKGECK